VGTDNPGKAVADRAVRVDRGWLGRVPRGLVRRGNRARQTTANPVLVSMKKPGVPKRSSQGGAPEGVVVK